MFIREEFENDKVVDIQNAYLDADLRRKGLDFVIQSDKHCLLYTSDAADE